MRDGTDEDVPLWVQVSLISEAALHDVLTVTPARLEVHKPAAVRTIQHPSQRLTAAGKHIHLEIGNTYSGYRKTRQI